MDKDVTATVVFDFDYTLTQCDSSARFFRYLILRNPAKLLGVLLSAPLLLPAQLHRNSRIRSLHVLVWWATWGISAYRLAKHIRQYVAKGTEHLFYPQSLARIKTHCQQGDQVVVATGSLHMLVDAMLAAQNINAYVVGSTLKPFFGGWRADCHCIGHEKLHQMQIRQLPQQWQVTYSDHSMDMPILRQGEQRVLINPSEACLTRIEAALGRDNLTVLRW